MSTIGLHRVIVSTTALAGALVGLSGCSLGGSPPRAESGWATRIQAQVATVALAGARARAARAAAPSAPSAAAAVESGESEAQPGDAVATRPPVDPTADLRIARLVLARGVEAREPIGAGESFALDEVGRLYAFVEVRNPDQLRSAIYVTFEPEQGPSHGHVRLAVGPSPRWRTWAYTRGVRTPGAWTAVVRRADGTLLAERSFTVEPTATESPADEPPVGRSPASPRSAAQAEASRPGELAPDRG